MHDLTAPCSLSATCAPPRQSPYHCNLLLAGYDDATGPSLYWMDYLATLNQINTGGTGYGGKHAHALAPYRTHAFNWSCMPFMHVLSYVVGSRMATNCSQLLPPCRTQALCLCSPCSTRCGTPT